ncbi:Xaa-Pro peptidase family protein [Devosia rhodophyticola]|uniref:Xaa-Pro peptidase family protein n=1 Tax=Devosia rhodophyticola TaxID=3026423 RepID=A0ABY7YTN5_9HYPH|nr:Xaa-Pro peptidase family protein [Devosia rhodophyticola]WDR04664.1 Xaa-Pro peptidase family protein [Devosia rhodophyticola]
MSIARGFSKAEFAARTRHAQQLMAERGLGALLVCTEPEVRYFTGFLTPFWQSPTRPWFLIVPPTGKPIAVIPEIGVPLMATTWLDDIRHWPSPRPEDDGVSLLIETLTDIGASHGNIGLPMGPETVLRMPLNDYQRLRAHLCDATFVDATDIIRTLRMVKSEAEIAKLADICRIVSNGFAAVPANVHAGDRLCDVFAAFRTDLIGRGADEVPYLIGAAAPGGYDNIIAPPRDAPLAAGDLLMMDTGATRDGYFSDFDRNFAIGFADDATRRAYDTLFAATEAGLAAAHPGATCADLFNAMGRVIADAGYQIGNAGRFGHGLGMQLTEWPSLRAADRTVLAPGMVLTLEPSLSTGPGRGMVHEENIVIRVNGPQLISQRAAPKLPVINP